jgi:adenine-specific DNA-methyltransferase
MGSIASHNIESRRQEQQIYLDTLKTAAERNKWGQFATPPELALSIARYVRDVAGLSMVRFLDPAIGTGSFFSAIRETFPADAIVTATGVELDSAFADAAEDLWRESGLQIVRGDFTKQQPQSRYNLVLTNPPYVRHHHLSTEEKNRLKGRLARFLSPEISGLAGLYCYFLLLSHDWMEDEGLAVWLIPSEFMDVNYGSALRRYLTGRVTLLHIHRFCPTDVQFTDALVSSAIVVFRKAPPPQGHHARFSFAGSIEKPQSEAQIPLETLRRSRKWTQFPARTSVDKTDELRLGDIFAIKRGLATGSNRFFILGNQQIHDWKIPRQFLKPILPGPRHLTADMVEASPDGSPVVSPQLYLLDCSEPEEKIRTLWPRFYDYLQRGKKEEIAASYLASHRVPWYSQEQRPPAPFLCTYMGRSRNGKHPFRFIWNRSHATAHNVYLMLYPKGPLLAALQKRPELEEQVFNTLRRITPGELISEGRVYGGGLHKVEPKELAQIPARPILDGLDVYVCIERQENLFAENPR